MVAEVQHDFKVRMQRSSEGIPSYMNSVLHYCDSARWLMGA